MNIYKTIIINGIKEQQQHYNPILSHMYALIPLCVILDILKTCNAHHNIPFKFTSKLFMYNTVKHKTKYCSLSLIKLVMIVQATQRLLINFLKYVSAFYDLICERTTRQFTENKTHFL